MNPPQSKPSLLTIVGPGLLVAATGVGAGDLATGAFTGSKLGLAVLWAVVAGAFFKFVLNEGLARWQLATGETLLEGVIRRLGRFVGFIFLIYLVAWSFFVGSALMSACGVTFHAILPISDPQTDKIIYGIAHSLIAVGLVRWGGYRLFERVMSVCIGIMFVIVLATAVAIQPDWMAVLQGLTIPTIPRADGEGLAWTVALMGGVGGTVTVLCYGYWIREENRSGEEVLSVCRIDLAIGYAMTALFGIGMVILGSTIETDGKGASLVVHLADRLEEVLGNAGPTARIAFLIGAWGAVGSSLLGVWQSVPYLFADVMRLLRAGEQHPSEPVSTDSATYRWFLYALATIPAIGLFSNFQQVQMVYAIVGAMFIPILAIVLLILNSQSKWIGSRSRNSIATTIVLTVAVLAFAIAAGFEIHRKVLSLLEYWSLG
ncbi:Nramp family divalent metal transporter [Thalassoroseus pseudoceratinae]|uniref:Nramp family divalent metal transporter n=1 Tax=Thalassoroseus pseudoceratinae TaxID=2713176 RepID=UPI00141DF517|nr:Nramp family divalent metal transporter [Thalassoroseus pseudoceratinae]